MLYKILKCRLNLQNQLLALRYVWLNWPQPCKQHLHPQQQMWLQCYIAEKMPYTTVVYKLLGQVFTLRCVFVYVMWT